MRTHTRVHTPGHAHTHTFPGGCPQPSHSSHCRKKEMGRGADPPPGPGVTHPWSGQGTTVPQGSEAQGGPLTLDTQPSESGHDPALSPAGEGRRDHPGHPSREQASGGEASLSLEALRGGEGRGARPGRGRPRGAGFHFSVCAHTGRRRAQALECAHTRAHNATPLMSP